MLNPETILAKFGRPADSWLVVEGAADGHEIGAQVFDTYESAKQSLRLARNSSPMSKLAVVFNELEELL